jgi:hypothetical protein
MGGTGGATALEVETPACAACEMAQPFCAMRRSACFDATGTAAKGTRAGANKSDLCKETLSCINTTNCADVPIVAGMLSTPEPGPCYCGSTDFGVCGTQMIGTGACAEIIQAGTESASAMDAVNRLNDPTFSSGAAIALIQCASIFCPKSCGLCAPSDPACLDMPAVMAMGGAGGMSGSGGESGIGGAGGIGGGGGASGIGGTGDFAGIGGAGGIAGASGVGGFDAAAGAGAGGVGGAQL